MRLPFQVLVIPFIQENGRYYYAVFKRKDLNIWQFIAGGGENNEKPEETMKREAFEEAGIDKSFEYIRLSSITTIPAVNIRGLQWEDTIMIPEIAFGIELHSRDIKIGSEHYEYLWLNCEDAINKLEYDSNKSAVWELNYRLINGKNGIERNMQSIKNIY